MLSSASTWLFNATLKTSRVLYPQIRIEGRFISDGRPPPPASTAAADLLVIKTHGVSGAAASWLADRAQVIIITIRDPRDAVTSLIEHNRFDFGTALGLTGASIRACVQFAADPRSALLHYRDGFSDDPATIGRIAALLGGRISPAAAKEIFVALSRPAIETFIGQLDTLPTAYFNPYGNDLFDQETHWHQHHAGRSGRSGRWRERLIPSQLMMLESWVRAPPEWFDDPPIFGYRLVATQR